MRFSLLHFFAAATSVFAYSSPPSGAVTVGTGGTYSTLSAALSGSSGTVFFIYAGTYSGQTIITRSGIKIYGQTTTDSSYTGNQATLTYNRKASDAGSNDASGTLQIHAANVAIYNLNIVNSYGTSSSHEQAIALSVQASQFGCYGCQIRGYQDTLLANVGYQIYSSCLIEGAVDFIFGRTASIWISSSIIHTIGTGWVTASGRESADSYYYVISASEITGTGTQYLGRPWGNYARVVVQSTYLHSQIQAAGWSIWNSGDERTDHVTFAEYGNSGDGASGTRASFATKLSAKVSIATVLGSGYASWVDTSFPIA
ncbi:pectin lyase-like protein [Flagelloscypha sp. PMI_526]|nr:pectin lyase-like protein [Flagelloscypha sp. PMI_526]